MSLPSKMASKRSHALRLAPTTRSKLTYDRSSLGPRNTTRRKSAKSTGNTFFDAPSFGDLSNPVHPIFQSPNFTDPSINYETLENSLRLASRFVTANSLLPFWHKVLNGPIEVAKDEPQLSPVASVNKLSVEQTVQVVRQLELLAQCVSFSMEKNYWNWSDTGFTERLTLDAPSPFRGVRTSITISQRVFRNIEKSFSEPSMDNRSRLWTQVLLANLLVHELAHAAMHAAHPRPPAHDPIQAYFLPGARTTEEGMEWEVYAFGGLLYEVPSFLFWDRKKGLLGSKIVLREWPNPRVVAHYKRRVYPRPFPVKGDLPEHDRLWLVEPSFVKKLFTTEFWEATLPRHGQRALWPTRSEGFVMRGPFGLLAPEPERNKS